MRKILSRKLEAFAARRSMRMSKVGRDLESEIERYLQELQDAGKISGFIQHGANSLEDSAGKDFTVWCGENGTRNERSFGVTISLRRWGESKHKHPDVPQFCFPIGTKKETMTTRILSLFGKKPEAAVAA